MGRDWDIAAENISLVISIVFIPGGGHTVSCKQPIRT